jgi:hypothetical protein
LLDDIDNSIYLTAAYGSVVKTLGVTLQGVVTKATALLSKSSGERGVVHNYSYLIATNVDTGQESISLSTYKLWPGSGVNFYRGTYKVLRNIVPSGEFSVLLDYTRDLYLDTGRGVPTVVYDRPVSGEFVSIPSSFLATSFQNEANTFEFFTPDQNICDARLFDIADKTYFPYSGEYPNSLMDRYIGAATGGEDFVFWDSELTASGCMVLINFPSGIVTHIDFTNYVLDPYIFCSVDTVSGEQQFFQRDTETTTFISRSISLPNSAITIIRADDNV